MPNKKKRGVHADSAASPVVGHVASTMSTFLTGAQDGTYETYLTFAGAQTASVDSALGVTGYPFVMECRARTSSSNANQTIMTLIDAVPNDKQYDLSFASGRITLNHRNAYTSSISSGTGYDDGAWYCIRGKFLSPTEFELYVGTTFDAMVLVASEDADTTAYFQPTRFALGSHPDDVSNGQFLTGDIEQARVYSDDETTVVLDLSLNDNADTPRDNSPADNSLDTNTATWVQNKVNPKYTSLDCLSFVPASEHYLTTRKNIGVTGYPFVMECKAKAGGTTANSTIMSLTGSDSNEKQYGLYFSSGYLYLGHRNGQTRSIVNAQRQYNTDSFLCIRGKFLSENEYELWVGHTWNTLVKVATNDPAKSTTFFLPDRFTLGANLDDTSNGQWFDGEILEARVYSDDMETCVMDLPITEGSGFPHDVSGKQNHLEEGTAVWTTCNSAVPYGIAKGCEEYTDGGLPTLTDYFTIVRIPDSHWGTNETLAREKSLADWIVANADAENIVLVSHDGDVIDGQFNTVEAQDRAMWVASQPILAPLTASNIPFIIGDGNHDYLGGTAQVEANNRTNWIADYYDFTGKSYYAGCHNETNPMVNYFYELTIEGTDYTFMTIEFKPRDEVVDWASGIIAAHPERTFILQSHEYIAEDLKTVVEDAQYLHDNLVMKHANVNWISCGHSHATAEGLYNDTSLPLAGDNGNVVNISLGNVPYWNTELSLQITKVYYNENVATTEDYFPYSDTSVGNLRYLHWETV